MIRRFRASMPPLKRSSIALRAVAALGAIFLDHLVHAHAARDHGVHVRFGVYVEVQNDAAVLLLRPPDGGLYVVALLDGPSAQPIGGGELLVVRAGYGRLGVAAVVKELLPLAHHAEVAVVEDGHLDVQPEVPYGRELLQVHLDAAVACHDPNGLIGVGERYPHRRREREAHRAETTRSYMAILLGELEELGGPHLVLADVGDEPDFFAGRGLYGGHDPDRAVLVPRSHFAPLLWLLVPRDLRPPLLASVLIFHLLEVGEDAAQGWLRVGGDPDCRLHDLAQLGGIDVYMHDLGVWGEPVCGARDPVVEAHPDGEEEIRTIYRPIHARRAVHPRPADVQRVVLRERADPQQGRHDWHARPLGEQPELHLRPGERDAVPRQDERPLRLPEKQRRRLERRALERRGHLFEPPVTIVLAGCELHVLWHVHEDRPGAARACDLERPPHRRV